MSAALWTSLGLILSAPAAFLELNSSIYLLPSLVFVSKTSNLSWSLQLSVLKNTKSLTPNLIILG